jgi:branched-subunit amino acid transport protein
MTAFLVLAAIGAISLGYRSVFVLLANVKPLPAGANRALRFGAPAMLAAVLGSVVAPEHGDAGGAILVLTAAVFVGGWVAHRTRSIGFTVAAGVATFWLLAAIGIA